MSKRYLILLLGILLALVISSSPSTYFRVIAHWTNTAWPLLPLTLAAGLFISSRQIDLAVGAIFSLTAISFVAWLNSGPPTLQRMIAGSLISAVLALTCYALIYVLSVLLHIPTLISTLSVAFGAQSGCLWLWKHEFAGASISLTGISNIPPASWLLQLAIAGSIILIVFWRYRSLHALQHIAIGFDQDAAEIAGVPLNTTYAKSFLLAGLLVTLASFSYLFCYLRGGWTVNEGWAMPLDLIVAAVIGGTRITGGRFTPVGVCLATILVVGLRDTSAARFPPEFEYLALGACLLAASLADTSLANFGGIPVLWYGKRDLQKKDLGGEV